jgi:hypothetical protein
VALDVVLEGCPHVRGCSTQRRADCDLLQPKLRQRVVEQFQRFGAQTFGLPGKWRHGGSSVQAGARRLSQSSWPMAINDDGVTMDSEAYDVELIRGCGI